MVKKGGKKISLYLWLHTSVDILWLVNGIIFVVLLFASGQAADNKPQLFGIDKKTGKRVGAVETPRVGGYGLMTYLHQGKQYVIIPVSGGYTAMALP